MEIFDYDNILLLPRKCRVESRSECDASVQFGPRRFRLPVVPANMKTVVDASICLWLARHGYFYVMHRFDLDNVATPEAVIDLENWGADATKVGGGPGKVCITRLKTGFGTGGWQLSAVKWCARVATKPIVADGGIRHHGDIAKSIRFGATMIMIGSLFAGHEESPGRTVEVDGVQYKEYYGSASDFNKGEYKHVEGKRILEPIKGRLADTLTEMEQDVQSSISYAGGRKLMDVRKVNYVILGGDNAGEHLLM